MKTNKAIFFGYHNGSSASVAFELIDGLWHITLAVGDKTVTARSGTKDVKPCMTHATYLINEHFPVIRQRPAKKKRPPHSATVVQSSFIETKTGVRLRVVRRNDYAS